MNIEIRTRKERLVIRQCHKCAKMTESVKEQESCASCGKSFLPLNYFTKVHDHSGAINELYAHSSDILEEDLVKGIFVIW